MRLFRTPFDQLNLAIPVVFLTFAIAEYFSGSRSLWQYQTYLKYVQDIIFFNGLHVCLTFVYLGTTVSGRQAVSLFIKNAGYFGIARVGLVFFGSAGIYYFTHANYRNGTLAFALFYIALTALRRRHDLGQSKGLLRIANREFVRQNPYWDNDAGFRRIQQLEHYFIKAFYFTSLTSVITYFDYGIELGAWTKLTFKISLTLSMLLAAGVTACALLSPKGTRLWKFIYSTRFYIKAFGPFSAIAAYAGAAVHGAEYVFVTDKIVQSEKRQGRLLTSIFTLSSIILGAFLAFAFFRYPSFFIPSLSKQDKLPLLSLAVGIVITHYYLDHLIFTPKYQFARPLLKTLSEPIQSTNSNTVHDLKAANS